MPRQEDPTFPNRAGQIVVPFPGASPETVEELIVVPLEEELAEVGDIDFVNATARTGVAIVSVVLQETVYDTDAVWDEIDDALANAELEFPPNALPAETDYALTELESVVIALTGPADPLVRREAARELRSELLRLESVARVELTADPGRQIAVELADAQLRLVESPVLAVAGALDAHTTELARGVSETADQRVTIGVGGDALPLDAIGALPLPLPDGGSLPLGELAQVTVETEAPLNEIMRYDGVDAIAVGVVPQPGINVVDFGADVRAVVEAFGAEHPSIQSHYVTFQPARVDARLRDLGRSLVTGMAIVAMVLVLAMGFRLGLVVASVIPIVTLASLTVYALSGGVLQQISVAGLVIALGLLVDNAIVVAERVQFRIDDGEERWSAAAATVRELALPLASATATTLASFIPLLLSKGASADFTRAIPQVVMLSLTVSFFFALTVTPTAAALLFRRGRAEGARGGSGLGRSIGSFAARRPFVVLVGALALVGGSVLLAGQVGQQFFPSGDRNQLVLEIELPEGASIEATDRLARALESHVRAQDDVETVATFVGRSTPPFYYNLLRRPRASNVAQLLVTAESVDDLDEIADAAREFARDELPGVTLVARTMEQGPPIVAPVEIRVYGDDLDGLWIRANALTRTLRQHPDTTDVRHTLSGGALSVRFEPYDPALRRLGLTRSDLGIDLFAQTLGAPAGEVAWNGENVPVRVRREGGTDRGPSRILTSDLWTERGPVPIATVATLSPDIGPGGIQRRDGRRVTTVLAQLQPGTSYSTVLAAVSDELDAIRAESGFDFELGGEAEGSEEANSAIGVAAPLGVLVLLAVLLAQFRSFRKVGIVLMTVPLAAAGVIPGLFLANQPFGFTSLLGVIALIGIVVNNAIILIDFIDSERGKGATVEEAIREAVSVRIRPILLTTVTTIAGLVPLLYSSSTLWPPMASALISGLIASTALTLVVIPAAYRLLFRDAAARPGRAPQVLAAALVAGIVSVAGSVSAQDESPSGLELILESVSERSDIASLELLVEQAEQAQTTTWRDAFLPVLEIGGDVVAISEATSIDTPLGPFETGDDFYVQGAITLRQTVLDLAEQLGARGEADVRSERQRTALDAARLDAGIEIVRAYYDILELRAARQATIAYVESLESQLARVVALVDVGRALEIDQMRLDVALSDARQVLSELERAEALAELALRIASGRDELSVADPGIAWSADDLSEWVESTTFGDHPIVAVLEAEVDALEAQRRTVNLSSAPIVFVEGSLVATDNEVANPQTWVQGMISLRWSPLTSGVRDSATREIDLAVDALQLQREWAVEELTLGAQSALTAFEVAESEVALRNAELALATEARDILRAQFDEGRADLNDVLAAEADVLRAQSQLLSAGLRTQRHGFEVRHALGLSLLP